MVKLKLNKKPEQFRTLRATVKDQAKVDMAGGKFGAGIMRGVSVTTVGEALGHELWLDAEFVSQVDAAIKAKAAGLKSRFTHPGMSSDGLGKHLGRLMDSEVSGDRLLADLHFSKSAHSTPDGDLAQYVADLATEDPSAAGLSIVFYRDYDAEYQFMLANGASIDDGWVDESTFKSPDPGNVNNYPHARLRELCACDVVDEPAANPDGMFSTTPIVREADGAMSYMLGLSEDKPVDQLFGVSIDRAKDFFTRFIQTKGLSIMSKATSTAEPVKQSEQPEVTREQLAAEVRAELAKFTSRFGSESGVKWFNEGKSYGEAIELHVDALTEQLKAAKEAAELSERKLASIELGEKKPLETAGAEGEKKKVPFAKAVAAPIS